jgi:hypothetical protein
MAKTVARGGNGRSLLPVMHLAGPYQAKSIFSVALCCRYVATWSDRRPGPDTGPSSAGSSLLGPDDRS